MEFKLIFNLILILVPVVEILCADTVKIEIISRPKECKEKAAPGDDIHMHYEGKLANGKPFDSSTSRNTPFNFKLGVGMVILCWDQGVPGMCVGEKRKLTCPPEYAYGDKSFGDIIPAKSTLIFEIELVKIDPQTPEEKKKTQEKLKEAEKKRKEEEKIKSEAVPEEEGHQHPDAFESVDKDGNGEVSRDEMFAYIKSYQDDDTENPGEKPTEEELNTLVSDIFQADDKNKDGVLSKHEYDHGGEMDGDVEGDMKTDTDEMEEKVGKDEL